MKACFCKSMSVTSVNLHSTAGHIKRIAKIKEDLSEESTALSCLHMFLFSVDWMMEMPFCMV